MTRIKLLFSALITMTLFYLLQFPQQNLAPFPMGKFLNPFSGFWHNDTGGDEILSSRTLTGLKNSVIVQWDDRRVPHVFAQNDHDLYFTQGYLTARDRLWQMDFITRAAAGRIAEVVPGSLEYDRYRRRVGMIYAAENALKMMLADSVSRAALEAYTLGVNAWVEALDGKDFPLEFKILNYRPELWTPLKSALLLKYMAWELSGFSEELMMTRTRLALGDSLTEALFFRPPLLMEPVIPAGTPWPFQPLPVPDKPEADFFQLPLNAALPFEPDPANGSNNWAVSGSKTRSGYPILCSDPHLGLRLPSIWYEMQLVSPTVNAYGVTLPGTPTVIIGFNREVAWGQTNAGTDVLDWYEVEFKEDNPWEYRYGDAWLPAQQRIERIAVRGGGTVVDTIPITQHGLVVYRQHEKAFKEGIPTGTALRWAAHDPSNELRTFLLLNRARNYDDFVEALSYYDCPGQNFVFASAGGDIAMHHNGKFPLRWPRQGRYISDGRDPAYQWQGWIPREQLPKTRNPARGFVASANQNPAAADYPYYMDGKYASFERGARINERLEAMQRITPEDMMQLQNDNLNLHARTALPRMLAVLEKQDLSLFESRNLQVLQEWNYMNHRDSIAPIIWDRWWDNFQQLVWEDECYSEPYGRLLFPRRDVTVDLVLNDSASSFFDIRSTADTRETFSDLLLLSFQKTDQDLTQAYGTFGEGWRWGKSRGTDIPHMAKIPGLGRMGLDTSGDSMIVNATKKRHGPSWRMVVALGPEVKAWGIYPGGQSGNPGSKYYDDFVDSWVNGKYYELLYLKSPGDSHPRLVGKSILQGGAQP